jgi:hypothetical protein
VAKVAIARKLAGRLMSDSPDLKPHDELDVDKLDYVMLQRKVYPRKGKWLRFSEEQIEPIGEHETARHATPTE